MSRLKSRGIVYYSVPIQSVLATAHTALQGFFWIVNSVPTHLGPIAVRRVAFKHSLGGTAAMTSTPTIQLERVVFDVGSVPGGTAVKGVRRESKDTLIEPAVVLASTGLTNLASVNTNAALFSTVPPILSTGVGSTPMAVDVFEPPTDEQIILQQGEGLVCRQVINGTASDARRFTADIVLEPFGV